MLKLEVSITVKQQRALEQKITRAGKGTLLSEIRNAITQYLASPKQIESAFLKVLKDNAPKDLPPLSTIQKKLNKTTRSIDRTLGLVRASERRMAALDAVDTASIGRLALETFGSAQEAYAWLHRPHKALGQRTPFSLLTSASGYKRVNTLLGRIAHGVYS